MPGYDVRLTTEVQQSDSEAAMKPTMPILLTGAPGGWKLIIWKAASLPGHARPPGIPLLIPVKRRTKNATDNFLSRQ
jgi:hypothetical protein